MSDAPDPYQALILEHGKRPRNAELPAAHSHAGEADNALCGDRIQLQLQLDGERITAIGYRADGCLLSIAAASLMSEAATGASLPEVEQLAKRFRALLEGRGHGHDSLGDLVAFAPLADNPMRRGCATLPFDALRAALTPTAER